MHTSIDEASTVGSNAAVGCSIGRTDENAPTNAARGDERPIDLARVSLSDIVRISSRMRTIGDGCESMEDVADALVRYFYDRCRSAADGAHQGTGAPLDERTRCLTLLATTGSRPQWNSRRESSGHKAIPLVSEQAVANIPMIAQLIRQFGLDIRSVVDPREELLCDLDGQTCNVFHVEHASGSRHIPAQADFVAPLGIRSALGFGGMLPTGNLFAVIAFATAHIPPSTAKAFRSVALAVKSAILPFEPSAVFRGQRDVTAGDRDDEANTAIAFAAMRSKANALDELGKVHDEIVTLQAERLERTVNELEIINDNLIREIEHRKAAEAERERLQGELVIASRQAGMAEVATGVLHNVGNVLTSINVSVNLLAERLQRDWSAGMNRLSTLLSEHELDLGDFLTGDSRGRRIPEYVARLSTALARRTRSTLRRLILAQKRAVDFNRLPRYARRFFPVIN
ncbi:MAG: hypothetical protein WD875_04740 [Pirellulales bacterium]